MEFVEGETLGQILARLRGVTGVATETWDMAKELSRLFDTSDFGDDSGPRYAPGAGLGAEPGAPPCGQAALAGEPGPAALETRDITADYCYKVAAAFAEVAEGLQHAHSSGVTHRDIKPSNLILDRSGHLRILDFGLARLEGQQSLTVSGDLVGTVLYMSPEQAMARRVPVDHRTDVHSLGATLYETMTWRAPFQRKTYQETLSDIIFRDPEPPRKLNPRIPKDLETIVLKCMTKDPVRRYNTAEALAQDLRRFVRGDPIEARPQSPWELAARRSRSSMMFRSIWPAFSKKHRWVLRGAVATAREMPPRLDAPSCSARRS
jgi:serine/threonine-protein kinase